MSLSIVRLTLILTSVFGFYALWGFSVSNGLFEYIAESSNALFRNGPESATLTGLAILDEQLKILVSFFWPVIDGSRPDLCLHAMNFAFQGGALWLLLVVEGLRRGNRWKTVSFTTIFGLVMQNVGFAVVTPAFLAIHLWTSATVHGPASEDIWIDPNELNALPVSLIVGLVVPSVVMSLPAPSMITITQKQTAAAVWQLFPLWTYLAQSIAAFMMSNIASSTSLQSSAEKSQRHLRALRRVHLFGMGLSALGHIGTWSISLLAMLSPTLFESGVAEILHPSSVFLNTSPFSGAKAHDIAEGVKWFLQWDLLVGSTAVLLWAVTLKVQAQNTGASVRTLFSELTSWSIVSAFIGPSGAAVMALWTRDELVHGRKLQG